MSSYIPVNYIGSNSFAYCKVGEICENIPKTLPQTSNLGWLIGLGFAFFFIIGSIKIWGWLQSDERFIRS